MSWTGTQRRDGYHTCTKVKDIKSALLWVMNILMLDLCLLQMLTNECCGLLWWFIRLTAPIHFHCWDISPNRMKKHSSRWSSARLIFTNNQTCTCVLSPWPWSTKPVIRVKWDLCMNHISLMYGLDNIRKYGIWGCQNIWTLRKSSLKLFLAMHITNQKHFDIFTTQNIFMEHDLNILFNNVLLAIALVLCSSDTCVV